MLRNDRTEGVRLPHRSANHGEEREHREEGPKGQSVVQPFPTSNEQAPGNNGGGKLSDREDAESPLPAERCADQGHQFDITSAD